MTPEGPQPAADVKTSDELEIYLETTQQGLIQIPELELHWLMGKKEEKISTLVREKVALLNEVEQLKEMLENQTAKAKHELVDLLAELSKKGNMERDAVLKTEKLEEALKTEKEKRKEAETCLAQQIEETSKVKAALAQADKDLENKRCQWEEDRSRLLAEQMEATSRMKAALTQAQEDLENERHQWQDEKTCLLESIRTIKKTLEEKERERIKSRGGLMERLIHLENQMEEVQKKPKKISLRKRFLQVFKKTGRTPTPSDL
ncbi:MAG: hypothetical protein ACRC57_07460 [Sarcina sp.]